MIEPRHGNEQPFSLAKEMNNLMLRCQQPGAPVKGIATSELQSMAHGIGMRFKTDANNRLVVPVPHEDGDKDTYYLDTQGRVTRFEHKIGREGVEPGNQFITLEYDEKGRFTKRLWYKSESDSQPMYEEYVYPEGRPDNEYTRYVTPPAKGEYRLAQTYELRELNYAMGNLWTSTMQTSANLAAMQKIFDLYAERSSLQEIVHIADHQDGSRTIQIDEPTGWKECPIARTTTVINAQGRMVRREGPDFFTGKRTVIKEYTYKPDGSGKALEEWVRDYEPNGELAKETRGPIGHSGEIRDWPLHRLQGGLAELPKPGMQYAVTSPETIAARLPIVGAEQTETGYKLTRHLDDDSVREFTYDEHGRCIRMFYDHPRPFPSNPENLITYVEGRRASIPNTPQIKSIPFQQEYVYTYDKQGRLTSTKVKHLSPDSTGAYTMYKWQDYAYVYDNESSNTYNQTYFSGYVTQA